MMDSRSQHSRPMAGRTVVITGGTGGIGKATALRLAHMGATVAVTGRDPARGSSAATDIRAATGAPVHAFTADLSDQKQVRRLAGELLQALPRIDVLVNNAGGYWNTRHETVDGLERTFAVNHLAPFLLTHLLVGRLGESEDGRVVNVASNAQSLGRIDFDDLQGERDYSGSRAYDQSKLANVLFTYELGRRLSGTNITTNALHPGVVRTSFGAEDPGLVQRLLVPFARPFMRTPHRGSATSTHLASSAQVRHVQGGFFSNSKQKRSSARSYDEAVATRLWLVSETLTSQR